MCKLLQPQRLHKTDMHGLNHTLMLSMYNVDRSRRKPSLVHQFHNEHWSTWISLRWLQNHCITTDQWYRKHLHTPETLSLKKQCFKMTVRGCSDATWQEIGRMCGLVRSCLHPGSQNTVPPSRCVPLSDPSGTSVRLSVLNCRCRPVDQVFTMTCMFSQEWEMAFYEPGRGQLHTEPHIRPISCRITNTMTRTGRRTEQASSDEGLWWRTKR